MTSPLEDRREGVDVDRGRPLEGKTIKGILQNEPFGIASLKSGARVEIDEGDGTKALSIARQRGHGDIIELLLAAGAGT